jgi:Tfp pilus assembly protein PilF
VRATLERLLASETFGRSERARELLRYLVERQLAGEADRLKGFAIAVDVFGKDAAFDSSTDAVVRVQAGRLRELLNQYFATEGVSDPVRIAIPRGSYVPTYEANESALTATEEEAEPASAVDTLPVPKRRAGSAAKPAIVRQLRLFWGAIAVVIAMLGVLLVRQGVLNAPGGTESAGVEIADATSSIARTASPADLPVVYVDAVANGSAADRVVVSLRNGLSGFDTVDFIGRTIDDQPSEASRTSFVFRVIPEPADGGIVLELQNTATGRVLLSRRLRAAAMEPSELDDRIAGILTATVPASGAIYNYIEQGNLQEGLTQCLLLGEKYYLDQNARTHETAYRCVESLIQQDVKSPLVYSEAAALQLEAVTKRFPYPAGATAERAMELARHALQMGSTSASVHRAYGYLNSRLGKTEAAIHWMRKAYELNTYDLGMGAAYGYALIFAGNYAEGTPILERAVEASSARPTWWDFGLFAGKFMLGDMEGAKRASDALTTTMPKSHYLTARLISAEASGDHALSGKLRKKLMTEFPKVAANPRPVFLERNYPADLTDRLVKALHDAGLPNAS